MTSHDYSGSEFPVHLCRKLPGTPHAPGAKDAAGQVREGLRNLVTVLVQTGWADEHPLAEDRVSLDVIDLVDRLGHAERHVLRIAAAMLVKATLRNGYHTQ